METERAKRLADFVSWVGANIRGDEKAMAIHEVEHERVRYACTKFDPSCIVGAPC
jgi:hypothetical protein